jgi:isopentenyl diphosphate isomerase/L-lactate dehydrogenase-like FMN-dependent dehydrogenase
MAAANAQAQTDPKPADALNVNDLEAFARRVLPPAHFGYIATGVDGDATLRANTEAFRKVAVRPKRLVNIDKIDTSVSLFGTRWKTPLLLAPCGSQKGFHPEGEAAVARAAKSRQTLQVLSTATTTPVEEVIREAGYPVWYQLYATNRWETTAKLVRRAENAGCPVLVLTVDLPAGRNTETQERFKRLDSRPCATCHGDPRQTYFRRKPMFDGIDMSAGIGALFHPGMDWAFVDRLRALTKMKLVVKGIVTADDARLCLEHGVDGLIVSNHGGRAEDSGRGSFDALPEVAAAVGKAIPIILDGGIRRGTDIVKAIARGATAVAVGRPYLWGLGAFGQPGVERAIDLLNEEFDLAMRQCGMRALSEVDAALLTNPR